MSTTPERQKAARGALNRALASRDTALVIHYACESYDLPAPRVTSIAVRNLGTGQTQPFSILREAQVVGIELTTAGAEELDQLERKMLDSFFRFVDAHQNHHWLHWNMRDDKFGFAALEHRHRVLGGRPKSIPHSAKLDLAALMFELYGDRYAKAKPSRLQCVAERNDITLTGFLGGAAQAEALAAHDFASVHSSTLRKVDVICTIATLAQSGMLKTDAPLWDRYGKSVSSFFDAITRHWAVALAVLVVGLLSGIIGLWQFLAPGH